MADVLLDTSVIIDLLRGKERAVVGLRMLREAGDRPRACAVNVEETVHGLRFSEVARAMELFAGLRIVALGTQEGWVAGEWRRDYAEKGTTLAQADCLVAAAALSVGGRLATGNPKHFPMKELDVEDWPPG